MEVFGAAITLISVILAIQAWNNGKFMKKEMKVSNELLGKMHEHLVKMDEHLVKIDEHLIKIDEHLAKIDEQIIEGQKRTEQLFRYIADLIVSEGEKTRRVVESLKGT